MRSCRALSRSHSLFTHHLCDHSYPVAGAYAAAHFALSHHRIVCHCSYRRRRCNSPNLRSSRLHASPATAWPKCCQATLHPNRTSSSLDPSAARRDGGLHDLLCPHESPTPVPHVQHHQLRDACTLRGYLRLPLGKATLQLLLSRCLRPVLLSVGTVAI